MGTCIFAEPQTTGSLYTAIFASEQPHIIAFVGAGGKTTAITTLGWELKKDGHTTLITTTTHMHPPVEEKLLAENLDEAGKILSDRGIAWIGKRISPLKIAPAVEPMEEIAACAQYVLVEADGGKRHPLKMIDAAYEPVIPVEAQAVVAVAGLSGLGKPISEVVFRSELAESALQVDADHLVTPSDVARLLTICYHPSYVLLNQADTDEQKEAAREIAREMPNARVLALSLRDWGYQETRETKVF